LEDGAMKIKDLMISEAITITERATIHQAIEVMKVNSIRHLPVIDNDKILRGFLTLADLKLGLMPSMVGSISLADLIIRDPIIVHPDDDIEMAAQLIYKHKIGGMPVIDNNQRLVGIITESDILRAFIDMMGILTSSSRIDVVIDDSPKAMQRVLQIIHENAGDIINVGMTAGQTGKRTYYFRLSSCRTATIKKALENAGFEVPAAMD
jgi:acetoin utilization protein AcuB